MADRVAARRGLFLCPRSILRGAARLRGAIAAVGARRSGIARRVMPRSLFRRRGRRRARSGQRWRRTTPTLPRASATSRASATCRSIPPCSLGSKPPTPRQQRPCAPLATFGRGLLTGEPDDLVGLAGTALGDLFVFGDIRDAVREGSRLAKGEHADELVLGLACRRHRRDGGHLRLARRRHARAHRAFAGEGGAQDRPHDGADGRRGSAARYARSSIGRRCGARSAALLDRAGGGRARRTRGGEDREDRRNWRGC